MKTNPIPKVIALILVSVGVALLVKGIDGSLLSKIDSMSPEDYIKHQRALHQHSVIYHFITFLIFGGFYLGLVEFIAYLVGLAFPKQQSS